jgi:hypothetical protein
MTRYGDLADHGRGVLVTGAEVVLDRPERRRTRWAACNIRRALDGGRG